jgi:pimeloyl-ACP methyl ester carboxylesterase
MEIHSDVHEGNGPYLLLVHGILSSRAQYEPNLEALKEVCRPVTVELWGHGRSPVPEDPALYHPENYVRMFEQLREKLGVDTWMIAGQSLGGSLTIRYALDHPDRVSAQICTNSMAAFGDAEWVQNVRAGAAERARFIREGGHEAIDKMPFHPKNATRLSEEIRNALIDGAEMVDPLGVANAIEHTVANTSTRERLIENTVPMLLVCGTFEKRFKPLRDYVEEAMPKAEVVDLEAGHSVNLEARDGFDEAVVEFIRRHASR